MQWLDHLKKRKSAPPKVPRRVRGKKVNPERDVN